MGGQNGAATHPAAAKTKGKADALDRRVGQNIWLQRNLCGVTQLQLGSALGISFQQIQKYERGVNRVSAGRLYRIAQILNVPLEAFYNKPPVRIRMRQ